MMPSNPPKYELDSVTKTLLELLTDSLNVAIETEAREKSGVEIWAVTATDGKEIWIGKGETVYDAACSLAALMGFELEDG